MFTTNELLKKRTWAMTLDLFIVTATNYFLMAAFTNFVRTLFFHLPIRAQIFLIHKFSMMTTVSMFSLTFAYFSLFLYVTNGRTMGKTIFGLKVVNSDQSEITLAQAMKRSFSYFTCVILGSFLFALSFIRKDQKSLADLVSSSSVVDETDGAVFEKEGTEFQLTLLHSIQETAEGNERGGDDDEYFEQNKAA